MQGRNLVGIVRRLTRVKEEGNVSELNVQVNLGVDDLLPSASSILTTTIDMTISG